MEKINKGFDVLKWFVDLNREAKAVISLLCLIIIALSYFNYSLNQDIKEERLRYDVLSDKYANGSKDYSAEIDKINAVWLNKYESYRNLREEELKVLTKAWEDRYNDINEKIIRYEKSN